MSTMTKAEKILNQIKIDRHQLISNHVDLPQQVSEIKNSAAKDLSKMVDQAIQMLGVKGCRVSVAKNAQEAQEQVYQILADSKKVLLSKDPIFSEIALPEFLMAREVELVKTDLGENLAQGSEEIHPRIATINTPVTNKESVLKIRESIREQASQVQYGITGADAIVAETGTIALLESEGNVRLTSNLPYNHIVVVGMEKILYSLEDALAVCRASSIYGLGKDLLNYISFISGPSRTADIEFRMVQGMHGPKEVFVILVDNGRLKDSEQEDLSALTCLHCGGCLVDCPAYLNEGLKSGYRYTGKRQKVLAKFTDGYKTMPEDKFDECRGCDKCNSICPVGIQV